MCLIICGYRHVNTLSHFPVNLKTHLKTFYLFIYLTSLMTIKIIGEHFVKKRTISPTWLDPSYTAPCFMCGLYSRAPLE